MRCLDSLRGIACLIVLIAHIISMDPLYGVYANGCGKIGVWLFLVMSGFCTVLSFEKYKTMGKKDIAKYIGSYYRKKLVKLYPAYLFSVFLAFGMGYIENLIGHMFFLKGDGAFWYMPVMIKFYLIVPLFALGYRWINNISNYMIIVFIVFVVFVLAFPFTEYPENSIQLQWYIPVFMIGFFNALIYKKNLKFLKKNRFFDILIIINIFLLLLFTPAVKQVFWEIAPSNWLQNKYLLYGILWGILIISILYSKYTRQILENSIVLWWISNISYEIYLIHLWVCLFFKPYIHNMIFFTITVMGVSIMIAWIIHNTIYKWIYKKCNI